MLASPLTRSRIAVCSLLAAVVFVAYVPTLRNGFTGYDDPDYVTANPHVKTGLSAANVVWAFTAAHAGNWHPLTWISHMTDCSLFGLQPSGHHLVSLLLHIACTLLLFLWLSSATGAPAPSAVVALLFGLHPAHVESVAWAAERKDVLSTLFLMLALLFYVGPAFPPAKNRALVFALCAAGLMCKPMLVTLPLLLLIVDLWPLRRPFSLRHKLPLVGLAAISCAVTVWAQHSGGTLAAIDRLPLRLRVSNAALSYLKYCGKAFWPVRLAAFYPFPETIPLWAAAGSVLVLAAVTWLAWVTRNQRPWLAAGWAWYLVTLLPVIGFVQVGMQSMADRYLYVPIVGLLMAVVWEFHVRFPNRGALLPFAVPAAACALLTWNQVQVWKDGVTLFTHAIAVTDGNFVAHDNLGVELDRLGRSTEALAQYREAIRIRPGDRNGEANYAQANFAAGEQLFAQGKLEESLALFHEGLAHRPQQPLAHTYAGLILTQQHRLNAAIEEFHTALAMEPTLARAHMGLGVALAWSQRPLEAERAFQDCLRYDPSNSEALYDLGLVREAMGKRPPAH
jgi:protein O-mannosyl-transferase